MNFFKAIDSYETEFGRTILKEKDRKGYIKTIEIKFNNFAAFVLHLNKISGLSKGKIRSFLKKSFKNDLSGNVVVTEAKPCSLLYKKSTETLKYELCNIYGTVC